jgi:SAM-dependent methyltransferase
VRDSTESVVYYYCNFCGFLFSTHLDGYSDRALNSEVYNDDYWNQMDSDDRSAIPLTFIQRFMIGRKMRILDYGCGRGQGVSVLRTRGYDVFGYDIGADYLTQQCSNDWSELPDQYDFIFSFEVIEHLTQPRVLFEDAGRLLAKDGVLFFTTYLYDEALGREFWYLAPRNGHVSLFSRRTLKYSAARYSYNYIPLHRPNHHLFLRKEVGPLKTTATVLRYGIGTFLQRLSRRLGKAQAGR